MDRVKALETLNEIRNKAQQEVATLKATPEVDWHDYPAKQLREAQIREAEWRVQMTGSLMERISAGFVDLAQLEADAKMLAEQSTAAYRASEAAGSAARAWRRLVTSGVLPERLGDTEQAAKELGVKLETDA